MFRHVSLDRDIPSLSQINHPNGLREYETPEGNRYPSVTTVLSSQPKPHLNEWKKRVGEEEAKRISTRAAAHGTRIHALAENYLLNKSDWNSGVDYFDIDAFTPMKHGLDKYVNDVWMLEQPMYSHHLRCAGTVDCVAEYDRCLSIIDFKTSSRPKRKEWITDYFMQASVYAVMFEERTGTPIRQLVIMIVTPEGLQTFVEDRDRWINKFIEIRNAYDE